MVADASEKHPKPVHADYGRWQQVWKGNRLAGYLARFPKGDNPAEALDHAQGLAWFLAVSNTTPKPHPLSKAEAEQQKQWIEALVSDGHRRGRKMPIGYYYPPKDAGDAYEIFVNPENTRRQKFESWAAEHDFLPDLARARDARNERLATLKPWRNAHAAGFVNQSLEWKKDASGLHVTLGDAPTAYALAIYLHNEKYLDGRAFGHLYWQTNQAAREGKAASFSVTIPAAESVRFQQQFPNACADKTLPGLFAGKVNPAKGRAKDGKFNWRTDDTITPPLFPRHHR